jgi:hypothetical protein
LHEHDLPFQVGVRVELNPAQVSKYEAHGDDSARQRVWIDPVRTAERMIKHWHGANISSALQNGKIE